MTPAEASPTVWHALRQRIEEELYSPRQNAYDEELYLPFVECFLASPLLDDDDRIRYRFQHECLLLNRRGTRANDIRLFKGKKKVWLSETVEESQADSVFILFFDPQCESCLQTISIMDADERLRENVKSGDWAVVAINAGRNSRYLPAMPREWLILNDKKGETRKAKNYFLRTMPKIYLVDKKMTVLSKNVLF